jgi:hypothetical protein
MSNKRGMNGCRRYYKPRATKSSIVGALKLAGWIEVMGEEHAKERKQGKSKAGSANYAEPAHQKEETMRDNFHISTG